MSDISTPSSPISVRVAIIGGGPAGLIAADTLSRKGIIADVYDCMPSVGRKFLLAGRGGLNLTHSETPEHFNQRFGDRSATVSEWLHSFNAETMRHWAHELGIETFVGTSGRVFPTEMKAAPLLRAWLSKLRAAGVRFHMRHRWTGWASSENASPHALHFTAPSGAVTIHADAVILALGGASWPRLGSDGEWVHTLEEHGITVAPLRPANCGFDVDWTPHLKARAAGQPLKAIAMAVDNEGTPGAWKRGECLITESGIEGSLVYALSAPLRDAIEASGSTHVWVDLLPDHSLQNVFDQVTHPRGPRSMASHLQSRLSIKGAKAILLRECAGDSAWQDMGLLARRIKALPIPLLRARPITEAISSAGGVSLEETTPSLMLTSSPGIFCAGEMLDWEAPTGGYLLTAAMASGTVAAHGVDAYLTSTS